MELDSKQREKIVSRSAKFQRVFRGADGEFVLNEIDTLCGYGASTFDPDPYKHAYKAGQRSMAVLLHDFIDQDVEKANKIIEKGKSNEK